MNKITTPLMVSLISLMMLLSGCSQSKEKEKMRSKVFDGSPTMKSILKNRHRESTPNAEDYRRAPDWSHRQNQQHQIRSAVYVPAGQYNTENYTRTEKNELNGVFPRLPNPDLCMYVDPHLTQEGATVPGYTSCFSMYDKNHFALPGEMSAVWQLH